MQNENKIRLQILNDLKQRQSARDEVYEEIIKGLESTQDQLDTLNFDLEHHQNYKKLKNNYQLLHDETNIVLKQKLILLNDLNQSVFVNDDDRKSFDELNEKLSKPDFNAKTNSRVWKIAKRLQRMLEQLD